MKIKLNNPDVIITTTYEINEQPTVDTIERKKGKWIRNSNGTYSCSLCQSWIPNEQHYYANYCLFCGADMREQNETDENERE